MKVGGIAPTYVYRQEGFEPALGDNLYVCIPCGKGFPSSEELNAHVETHTEEELYIKEEDDDSYPKEDEVEAEDLSSQITHVHGAESRRFSCSVCNKSYKDPPLFDNTRRPTGSPVPSPATSAARCSPNAAP